MKTILKLLTISVFCFLTYNSFAQHISEQDKFNYGKKYAFSYCMYFNYRAIDSSYMNTYKDASGRWSGLYAGLNQNEKANKKLVDFTRKITGKFYLQTNSFHFNAGGINTIICNCLNFYESAALAKFLIKLSPLQTNTVIQD